MPRAREVRITKDGAEAFVMEESVKAWVRHGWTAEDDGSSEEPAEKPAPAKKTTTRKAD